MTIIDTLREFRIGWYAIFDLLVSFLGVYLIAPFLSKWFQKINIIIPRVSRLFFTLPLSVLIHLWVGNMTAMTKNVLDSHGHYGIKIVMILCVIGWLWNISFIKK